MLDISVELALRSIRQDEPNPLRGVTVIRVLRIVRIVRVVRVIRIMKFFRELRMMIFSTLNSLQSVVWVFFFLFVLIYMFLALYFCEAASSLDMSLFEQVLFEQPRSPVEVDFPALFKCSSCCRYSFPPPDVR